MTSVQTSRSLFRSTDSLLRCVSVFATAIVGISSLALADQNDPGNVTSISACLNVELLGLRLGQTLYTGNMITPVVMRPEQCDRLPFRNEAAFSALEKSPSPFAVGSALERCHRMGAYSGITRAHRAARNSCAIAPSSLEDERRLEDETHLRCTKLVDDQMASTCNGSAGVSANTLAILTSHALTELASKACFQAISEALAKHATSADVKDCGVAP